jgi:Polyketide cyclase / dehydrase and lipid transport
MGDMITEVMHIKCPAAKAFELMADARNETRWNSGASKVELKSGEPISVGTQFTVVDKRGQHDAKITAHNRPEELSFVVHDAKMDVDIAYVLTEADGVTTMTAGLMPRARA